MDISIVTLTKMVGNLPRKTNHRWLISRKIECCEGGYCGSKAKYFCIEYYIFKNSDPFSLLRKEIQQLVNKGILLMYG